jgi:hypothetical protein
MKHSLLRAAAAAMALALAGCFQVEQKTTLMPDGSGKLEFTIGIKAEQGPFGGPGDEDPFENVGDPDEIEKNVKGIVAWTQPVVEEKDGWKRMRITGYFEDINKVRFLDEEQDEEGAPNVQLAFELKGSTLIVKDKITEEMFKPIGGGVDGEDEFAKQMREMMKGMFKGMKLSVAVAVPGKIAEAKGFTSTAGRDARLDVGEELLLGAMDGKEEAKKKIESLRVQRQVRWEGVEVGAAAVAEFKKELASAKANWPKVREDMKKQATEKKKNAPKDDDEDEGGRPPMGKDR